MTVREKVSRRAALELSNGDIVNLGIGMPTFVANYIPEGVSVILQTENGALNMGPAPALGEQKSDMANAGGAPITLLPGASVFDLATSFGIIRGGHVDVSVLGALQVDQHGNLANWSMPEYSPGMGGAMDLVAGTRRIIVVMQHNEKEGGPKFLKQCNLPLTGSGVVKILITEKAVFEFGPQGAILIEKSPEISLEELQAATEAEYTVSPQLSDFRLSL